MKYWLSLAGIVGGALWLLLSPHTAHAAEQQPRLDSYAPTQFTSNGFGGALITLQGEMWPNQQYGLSAALFDKQTLTQISLETFSYAPLGDRMVVQVPGWVNVPTPRTYDLYLTTINGTRTIAENAILVTVDEGLVVSPTPTGGNETVVPPEVTAPPPVIPAPSTDIVKDTSSAPQINSYTQERLWSSTSGGVLVINGSNWPMMPYGLTALLVNPTTGLRVTLDTISYAPDAGKLVVQTPSYGTGTTIGWYGLVVMTNNGLRTTIRHAVEYLG